MKTALTVEEIKGIDCCHTLLLLRILPVNFEGNITKLRSKKCFSLTKAVPSTAPTKC